jgi:hypothetical protein
MSQLRRHAVELQQTGHTALTFSVRMLLLLCVYLQGIGPFVHSAVHSEPHGVYMSWRAVAALVTVITLVSTFSIHILSFSTLLW